MFGKKSEPGQKLLSPESVEPVTPLAVAVPKQNSLTRPNTGLLFHSNEPSFVAYDGLHPYRDPLSATQKDFLKKVGIRFIGKKVVLENPWESMLKINRMVDQVAKARPLGEDKAVRLATSYIGTDGKLVFTRVGAPPPAESQFFYAEKFYIKDHDERGRAIYAVRDPRISNQKPASELLENADYYYAISQGHFPSANDASVADYLPGTSTDLMTLHEFGHMGGMIEHPDGMTAFREAAMNLWQKYDGAIPPRVDRRMFYVNEFLTRVDPAAMVRLRARAAEIGVDVEKLQTLAGAKSTIAVLSPEKLQDITKEILGWHREGRRPFGGGIRTADWSKQANLRLDALSKRLSEDLDKLGRAATVDEQERRRNTLRFLNAEYLFGAQAMSETNFSGWFKLAQEDAALEPGSPYYRYLCEGAYLDFDYENFCK